MQQQTATQGKIWRLIVILAILGIAVLWIYPSVKWYFLMSEEEKAKADTPLVGENSIQTIVENLNGKIQKLRSIVGNDDRFYIYPFNTENRAKQKLNIDEISGSQASNFILEISKEELVKDFLPRNRNARTDIEGNAQQFVNLMTEAKSIQEELDEVMRLKEQKEKIINLGLDLAGGVHFVLEVNLDSIEDKVRSRWDKEYFVERLENENVKEEIQKQVKEENPDLSEEEINNQVEARFNARVDAEYEETIVREVRAEKEVAHDEAFNILRDRMNEFGVSEVEINKGLGGRIIVNLPGKTSLEDARKMVTQAGVLQFQIVASSSDYPQFWAKVPIDLRAPNGYLIPLSKEDLTEALNNVGAEIPEGTELREVRITNFYGIPERKGWMLLKKKIELDGSTLVDARVDTDEVGRYQVAFRLNNEGTKEFATATRENKGKRMAILLDGYIKSAPNISTEIPTGSAVIQGDFPLEEAKQLAGILRAGSLPTELKIVDQKFINPTMGADNIQMGIMGIAIGFCLVLLFMIIYYKMFGFVANFALLLNLFIVLAVLSVMKFTMTLSGFLGIILTLGVGIDANVIIYERIKEELKTGKDVRACVSAGYSKAFSAIFDSNLTTIFAALVLSQLGIGLIKGFGWTLFVGIIVNMVTSLFITRFVVDVALSIKKQVKKLWI